MQIIGVVVAVGMLQAHLKDIQRSLNSLKLVGI